MLKKLGVFDCQNEFCRTALSFRTINIDHKIMQPQHLTSSLQCHLKVHLLHKATCPNPHMQLNWPLPVPVSTFGMLLERQRDPGTEKEIRR